MTALRSSCACPSCDRRVSIADLRLRSIWTGTALTYSRRVAATAASTMPTTGISRSSATPSSKPRLSVLMYGGTASTSLSPGFAARFQIDSSCLLARSAAVRCWKRRSVSGVVDSSAQKRFWIRRGLRLATAHASRPVTTPSSSSNAKPGSRHRILSSRSIRFRTGMAASAASSRH